MFNNLFYRLQFFTLHCRSAFDSLLWRVYFNYSLNANFILYILYFCKIILLHLWIIGSTSMIYFELFVSVSFYSLCIPFFTSETRIFHFSGIVNNDFDRLHNLPTIFSISCVPLVRIKFYKCNLYSASGKRR